MSIALAQHTDLHLKPSVIEDSVVFPGPMSLDPALYDQAKALLKRCENIRADDFTILHEGHVWRGRRDRQVLDGTWLRFRQMPDEPFNLESLPSPLPTHLSTLLLSPKLLEGGLVYICGTAGSGKTTTASATVVSRLHHYGGVAYTIEDPPEMPLNGWHGAGYCSQTSVAGDKGTDWLESFRCALRSQPAKTPQILFVGEIRNRESAQMMLRAASNGFLVISTGFGSDVVSSIENLIQVAGDESINMLASMLRVILYQRIRDGIHLQAKALVSAHGLTPVASRIRAGKTAFLRADQEEQELMFMRGMSPLDDVGDFA